MDIKELKKISKNKLLDGYKLIYLKYGGQDIKSDFSTADFVDVSWINI